MGAFNKLAKSLFGRKRPSVGIEDIKDGEILHSNDNAMQANPETIPGEIKPIPEKPILMKSEPEFQEPEFIEPEPPPMEPPEQPEPAVIEEDQENDPENWFVPEQYIVFLGSSGRSERTIKEYKWDLQWWNRRFPLGTLTRQNIEFTINNMHPATARRKIAVLRSFAKWQLRDGESRLHNEVSQLIPPKTPSRIPKDRGSDDFKYLSKQAKELCLAGDRRGVWIGLMLCCGLRISEIQNIKLSHGEAIKVLGKGNKERLVPAPSWLRETINRQMEQGEPWRQARSLIWLEMKKMKIKRPHSLRHTYASELVRQGFGLEEVKELLGHSKLDTTLIYAKIRLPDDVTVRLGVEH